MLFFCSLAEPEADAADITAAFEKFSDFRGDTNEAASFENALEFWSVGRHDDMLAGTDEVAGKAFGAFVVVDDDFVEVLDSFEFFVTLFIKSAWTVSNSMFVNDGDGEVEIVPEAVGMVGSGIDVDATISIELRIGVNLDELEAELVGNKSLCFGVGTVAATSEQVFSTTEAIALAGIEVVLGDEVGFDALLFEFFASVGLFAFASLRQARHDGDTVFDDGPVGGINAILAAFWWIYFDDFDASFAETLDDTGVLGYGFLAVDFGFGVVGVDFVVIGKIVCPGNEEFLVDHLCYSS